MKVLLLEAGGQDTHPLFHMPAGFAKMTKGIASWGWSTVPQKHLDGRVLWYTQARVIGGGSSINAQIYTRGNAKDYDAWVSEAGCEGWAIATCCPILSAPRTTSASPMRITAPAAHRRQRSDQSAAHQRGLPARRAGVRHPLQPGFQRRAAGRHRPLPGDGAQRPPLLRRRRLSSPHPRPRQPHRAHGCAGAARRGRERPRDGRGTGRRRGNRDRARRARGHRLVGGHRLAAPAAPLGHRPGRPPARGRRSRGARSPRRRRQSAGSPRSLRDLRVHRRSYL